jgi:hypothetical protein
MPGDNDGPNSSFGQGCRYNCQAKEEEMTVVITAAVVFIAILLAEKWFYN